MQFLVNLSEFKLLDLSEANKFTFGWLYEIDQIFLFNVEDEEEEERRLQRKKGANGSTRGELGDMREEDKLDSEEFHEKIAPMLSAFLGGLILAVLMVSLRTLSLYAKFFRHLWNSLYYTVFWNLPLRVFLEGYLPAAHG